MAKLVVALDMPQSEQALSLAGSLAGLPLWYKLGLELFVAAGPDVVRRFLQLGHHVFLDLKFHDIPNTVKGACASAATLGVHMVTIHLAGGEAMAHAALEGSVAGRQGAGGVPFVMGVTVLTSTALKPEEALERVVSQALLAKRYGLHGVVCSGLEAAAVKQACGTDFLCLTPGIRVAANHGKDDQARVCTPEAAVAAGSDFLVMGRPITQATDPRQQAEAVLGSMENKKT